MSQPNFWGKKQNTSRSDLERRSDKLRGLLHGRGERTNNHKHLVGTWGCQAVDSPDAAHVLCSSAQLGLSIAHLLGLKNQVSSVFHLSYHSYQELQGSLDPKVLSTAWLTKGVAA